MKKQISILIGSVVVFVLGVGSLGVIFIPGVVLADKDQNLSREFIKPIPASDIKLVKKTFVALAPQELKGKPIVPPGKDKNGSSQPAASGVLGSPVSGNRYAIVIGICDYPGQTNDLCLSDGDSLNMFRALTEVYGYEVANVYLFRDMNATFKAIGQAVSSIKSVVGPEDEVVFFFSGHGGNGRALDGDTEKTDEAIIVHDGQNLVYLWDGQLRDWFSGFNTSRIAFIFDSCLAGGMNDVAVEGRVIVMATSENQVAYVYSRASEDVNGDGILDGEGVLSHYFVRQGIRDGVADGYNQLQLVDGKVAIEEAFDYAKPIIEGSYSRQDPEISDNFVNDLLL